MGLEYVLEVCMAGVCIFVSHSDGSPSKIMSVQRRPPDHRFAHAL